MYVDLSLSPSLPTGAIACRSGATRPYATAVVNTELKISPEYAPDHAARPSVGKSLISLKSNTSLADKPLRAKTNLCPLLFKSEHLAVGLGPNGFKVESQMRFNQIGRCSSKCMSRQI